MQICDEMCEDPEAIIWSVEQFNLRRTTYMKYITKQMNIIGNITSYKVKERDMLPPPPLLELKMHDVSIYTYNQT